jgi:quercetin dioxygenase-like cupin family protein
MAREAGQTAAISRNPVSRLIGVAFVVIGAVSMVTASVHHRTFVKGLPPRDLPANYFLGFSLWVSIAMSLLGVALATLACGLGDLVMSRRERTPADSPRSPNGETASMIAAEVNEGGPPLPCPCDTPFEGKACQQEHDVTSRQPPTIETCPAPDRIVHLPIGAAVGAASSATLLKSAGLELIRLVIPAGKEIPPHRAPGEIILQCIEGHVAFEHDGHAIDLHAGDLLHLCPQESHALKGIADSSVLVTRLRLHADELPEKFPAE